jgi:pimeloyl-ACP methyl ester carboxylesterase
MCPRYRVACAAICLTVVGNLASPEPTVAFQDVPEPDIVGTWQGVLEAAGLRLVFHVESAEGGGFSGTMDSPDQGDAGIPATSVTFADGTLRFEVQNLGMTYQATLSEDGATLEGTFTQGAARLPLTLTRAAEGESSQPDRPQHPEPPFPYGTEEVRFESLAAGVTLAGTLTTPPGEGPFPGAVLVSGSGPQDRDESLMGHRPFLVLADHLTRSGIAVLRYDDRGVGESTGDFASATSVDFASDALAAVHFLRERPNIGPVGIVGHSEGGLVGPVAAVRDDAVAYVVMMAGPGLTGAEIIDLQSELISRAQGIPEEIIQLNRRTQQRLFEVVASDPDTASAAPKLRAVLEASLEELPEDLRTQASQASNPQAIEAQVRQMNSPWIRHFLSYDPRPTLEQVTVPVLAINGEKDLQVPAEINLTEIAAALERGGNPDATALMLPGLNHLFQEADTGSPSEYAQIPETMNPAALDAVSSWILSRFADER